MGLETFITGKTCDGNHVGRAHNIKAEQASDEEFVLGQDLAWSLQALEHFNPDSEIYKWHKERLEFFGILTENG